MRPTAESCLRNQTPILKVLLTHMNQQSLRVLELGSGTGQHSVFMARSLPNSIWQPTDLAECMAGIELWREAEGLKNVLPPRVLNVDDCDHSVLPGPGFDAVFMANTLHFVCSDTANNFIRVAAMALREGGELFIYGPFNSAGSFTSEGNKRLHAWLQQRDPMSGIKDREWLFSQAALHGLALHREYNLPANNLMFVFQRH